MSRLGSPCVHDDGETIDMTSHDDAITNSEYAFASTARSNAGGAAVVTKSGRSVRPTEKASENYVTTKHGELKTACSLWKRQFSVVRDMLSQSTNIDDLSYERYKLQDCTQAILTVFHDYNAVTQPSEKIDAQVKDAIQNTEGLLDNVRRYIDKSKVSETAHDYRAIIQSSEKVNTQVQDAVEKAEGLLDDTKGYIGRSKAPQSVVSGRSRLTKGTTSSSRSERRREELARACELDVKLQYMEKEEQLQKQLEDINRQKRKLEVERQRQEAIARATVYDDDNADQSLLSDHVSASVHDRIHDYVMNQNPNYNVTGDQHRYAQSINMPMQNLVAPLITTSASVPTTTSNVTDAYAHSATSATVQPPMQPAATVSMQVGTPTVNVQQTSMQITASQPNIATTNSYNPPLAASVQACGNLNPDAVVYIPGPASRDSYVQLPAAQTQNYSITELAQVFQQQMYMSRLPPPEPGVFSGDPLQFPGWLTSFELLIESRQITPAERLHYLKRYLSGQAKECIEGFVLLSTDSAYDDAKKLLKERFGNKFTVANAFRQKLYDWPRIPGNDGAGLMKLSDFLQQCETAMKVNTYLRVLDDCHENHSILKKLPDQIITRWSRLVSDWIDAHGNFPPFNEFCKFVVKEAKIANNPFTAMQSVRSDGFWKKQDDVKPKKHVGATEASYNEYERLSGSSNSKHSSKQDDQKPQASGNIQRNKRPCHLCGEDHHLDTCPHFLKKKLVDRTKYVKEERLCFGCLKPNHLSKDCKYKMKCKVCLKNHPTSLHDDHWKPREKEGNHGHAATEEQVTVARTSATGTKHYGSTSMIVPVYVSSREEPQNEQLVYAMLDTQSDASFITEKTCNSLQVGGPTTDLVLSTMSSDRNVVQVKKISNLVVRGYNSNKKLDLPTLYTTSEVPGNESHILTCEIAKQWPHLHPISNRLPPLLNAEFGLLIGYNCSQALMPREVIASSSDPKEPYGQRTDLGWSIVGMSCVENSNDTHVCYGTAAVELQGRSSIAFRTKVKEVFRPADFAQISEFNFEYPEERKQSYEDFKFMRQLTDSIHECNGHYEMPLPFKHSDTVLPDNKGMALRRLSHLKRRLEQDNNYKRDYENFMRDVINRGYCEKVSDDHEYRPGTKWFIPHHAVYHPKKPSKMRVVFDCSAKYKGVSLNDMLLQGPDMTNDLLGVLCRFRKEPIAISCDIEKMFYQFFVNEEHRDYLSFLWWDDDDYSVEPSVYRMTVHLFGAVSSPGCANFGMKKAADDGEEQLGKPAADFVRHDFYVDDGLTSVATAEQGIELVNNTILLCASKGLRLHKFVSNSVEVLQNIPLEERAMNVKSLQLDHEFTVERTLGLEWCVQLDCFQFKIILKDRPPTRRGMLSTVYSLYDPLGLLSPVVLVGRQILQDICKGQYDWDSPLPENIVQRWEQWKGSLQDLETLKIDRCYKPKESKDIVSAELHHFSDASTEGYGQCSYLRLVDIEGRVYCSLVMGKSRVTPLKQVTIPRLELTAAVLSVRMSSLLREQLQYDNIEETFWCDSRVTLGYISNDAKKFHVFVANRIQQIRDKTESGQWKYVNSQENPADHASRGLTVKSLLNSSFWFSGPAFLWQANIASDSTDYQMHVAVDDPEVRKQTLAIDIQVKGDNFDLTRFEYFSDWLRLKKAVALCLHYKAILKSRIKGVPVDLSKEIKVEDLCRAETEILKAVQCNAFKTELDLLESNSDNRNAQRKLKRTHTLYRLDPFMDSKGILRIGGRIQAASLSSEVKHPVVLPKCGHVPNLIAQHCHKAISHQGRGMTINEIRMSGYWILGCRSLVSSLINKCILCKRLRGTVLDQKMSDLPTERLEPSPPFTYCAVDYFGPFYIKEKRSMLKRYGVIFTCMSSRAVHLETSNSMDTDSFINALRRFVAVRGPIRQLRSDMGTNFVGAKTELGALNHKQIKDHLLKYNCDYFEFNMNVPSASHMGSVWERQIRIVRNVLESLLKSSGQQLDDESLRTLFYETMAIVNSRPLTVDNLTDPTSTESLTPNHLLHMKTQVVLPPPGEFQHEDLYVRRRWRRVQHLLNEFWKKWQGEYLHTLQQRQKWNGVKTDVRHGDIVIVKDDNLPRNKWTLAMVEDTFPSADGRVRKVKLRVATQQLDGSGRRIGKLSFIERPIHKLVLLQR